MRNHSARTSSASSAAIGPILTASLSILGSPLFAQEGAAAGDELAAPVVRALEVAVERGRTEGYVDGFVELFSASALQYGSQAPLLEELRRRLDAEGVTEADRRVLDWILIDVLTRRGDLREALERCAVLRDQLAEEQPELAVSLRCARLLDATGRDKLARPVYDAALELAIETGDEAAEAAIRLRIALFVLDQAGADSGERSAELRAFASREGGDPEFRNQAANVLALTGDHEAALELSEVDPRLSEQKKIRLLLRRTEWAIQAEDAERAQQFAWEARSRANLARDRRYALTLLVEAHHLDRSLDRLSDRFAGEAELDDESLGVWIDVLRRTGQVERAVEVFQSRASELDQDNQRELVEIYREAGREDDMVATYRRFIAERPESVEWRRGLARHYLENGDRETAIGIFEDYIESDDRLPYFVSAAEAMAGLSLDDLAERAVNRCVEAKSAEFPALLFLFDLRRKRGDLDGAVEALIRIDELAPADHPVRVQIAEGYERIGKADKAVRTLERLRFARGTELAEDLEMRLAWLYSEIGEEEKAFDRWRELWLRVDSLPRRRYAEDRLMTIGSRLGRLADIVIDLEKKLQNGTADERDAGLLVSLYTKVNDAVSATEVIEEQVRVEGGDSIETLQRQANVFLACTDYSSYEDVLRLLIQTDPENEADYLRSLVLSMLERGEPSEARPVLEQLKALDRGADSAEFEAGVFALANLREEAIQSYWRGIAQHPGRIEIYLLLGNLLRDAGETARGVGIFQNLAEQADRDDLFTIAIDGILNLRAGPPVLRWARRITLERLARGGDKIYLYRLLADLSEEIGDSDRVLDALEATLASAGTQRASMLRELMDRSSQTRKRERQLAYGRRLIGLGEVVPPQVYLDLGQAFLNDGDITAARRTFGLASALPDGDRFRRDVAKLFEDARYLDEALRIYRGVLVSSTGDLELMAKVCELQEQVGEEDRAFDLASRAIELLLVREPVLDSKEAEQQPQTGFFFSGNRNVDDFTTYYTRLEKDLLATATEEQLVALRDQQLQTLDDEMEEARRLLGGPLEAVAKTPRILHRTQLIRRLLFATRSIDAARSFELMLLEAYPGDESILQQSLRYFIDRGYLAAARDLYDAVDRDEEQKQRVARMVGRSEPDSETRFGVGEILQQVVPVIQVDDREGLADLVRRLDPARITDEEEGKLAVILAAASFAEDEGAYVTVARQWVQRLLAQGSNWWQIERILEDISRFLTKEERSEFARSIAGSILLDIDKSKNLMQLLPRLQQDVESPIALPEELLQLLDEQERVWAFAVVPVMRLLPADQRAIALQSIWSKVGETERASFLMQLVDGYDEPIDESFANYLAEQFQGSLKDIPEYFWYSVDRFAEKTKNPALVLRFAEALAEHSPDQQAAQFLRARMLLRLDRSQEAIEIAAKVLAEALSAEEDYESFQLASRIQTTFDSSYYDEFLRIVAENSDRSVRSMTRRAQVLITFERPSAALALLDTAIADFPEEFGLRQQRQRLYAQRGEFEKNTAELEQLVLLASEEREKQRYRNSLVGLWLSQGHPIKALAAQKLGQEDEGSTDEAATQEESEPSEGDLSRAEGPNIQAVAKAVREEDFETARLALHRFWRFGSSRGSRFTIVNGMLVEQSQVTDPDWPVEPQEEPDEAQVADETPRVGGLVDYLQPAPAAPQVERRKAFDVLADYEFAQAEMRRILRTLDGRSVQGFGSLLSAVAKVEIGDGEVAGPLREVLGTIEDGRGGNFELGLLTAMLEIDPTLEPERVQALSIELARTVEPDAAGSIRRLARLLAATGSKEESAQLFRWCAALFSAGAARDVTTEQLLQDARELFEGEAMVELVDQILTLSNPGSSPWQMERYETMVLRTWEEVLGPDRALERCRELCDGLRDVTEFLRRGPAKIAAKLHARVGEFDQAVELLEIATCRLPIDDVVAEDWYLDRWTQPGYWSLDDVSTLFPNPATLEDQEPETDEARARRLDWVERGGQALIDWNEEGRIRGASITQAMVLLAVQLEAGGRAEAAQRFLDYVRSQDEVSSTERLWIADALRQWGDEAAAVQIEEALLEERALHRGRIASVIDRVAERDGAEAALELGEQLVEWTLDPAMLERLIALAESASRDELVASWKELRTQREAAAEELRAAGRRVDGRRAYRAARSSSVIMRIR